MINIDNQQPLNQNSILAPMNHLLDAVFCLLMHDGKSWLGMGNQYRKLKLDRFLPTIDPGENFIKMNYYCRLQQS